MGIVETDGSKDSVGEGFVINRPCILYSLDEGKGETWVPSSVKLVMVAKDEVEVQVIGDVTLILMMSNEFIEVTVEIEFCCSGGDVGCYLFLDDFDISTSSKLRIP